MRRTSPAPAPVGRFQSAGAAPGTLRHTSFLDRPILPGLSGSEKGSGPRMKAAPTSLWLPANRYRAHVPASYHPSSPTPGASEPRRVAAQQPLPQRELHSARSARRCQDAEESVLQGQQESSCCDEKALRKKEGHQRLLRQGEQVRPSWKIKSQEGELGVLEGSAQSPPQEVIQSLPKRTRQSASENP